MLSLTPRYDLYEFRLPKTFFPEELRTKYDNILSKYNPSVLTNCIDYVNESIVGITLPGLANLTITHPQVSHNQGLTTHESINVEPFHENHYLSVENPLTKMDTQLTVTFRQNQGLLNYFLLYETTFHRYCRPQLYSTDELFTIYLKGENGKYISKVLIYQPEISGIDGLEFSFNKVERSSETFNVVFDFNNIDFDFLYQE